MQELVDGCQKVIEVLQVLADKVFVSMFAHLMAGNFQKTHTDDFTKGCQLRAKMLGTIKQLQQHGRAIKLVTLPSNKNEWCQMWCDLVQQLWLLEDLPTPNVVAQTSSLANKIRNLQEDMEKSGATAINPAAFREDHPL
jgi:hypothetical protein